MLARQKRRRFFHVSLLAVCFGMNLAVTMDSEYMKGDSMRFRLLALAGLVAGIAAAGGPLRADIFNFTSGNFDSPLLTNSNGTYSFGYAGKSDSFSLNPGDSLSAQIVDSIATATFNRATPNGDPPGTFTGDISYLLTIDGLSHTLTQPYSLDGTVLAATFPTLSAGSPVLYDFGGGKTLSVTPTFDVFVFRTISVSFLNPTAVPEPGSLALLTGLGVSSLFALRRRRRTAR
jgi:hypothetical protein